MAQIPPWYSARSRDRNVYHDDDRCPVGKQVEEQYRKNGKRCRKRCATCAKLQATPDHAERLAALRSF